LLHRGEADFALGRFGAARPGLTVEPLYEDRYCVIARRGHPRYRGAIRWEEYEAEGHVFSQAPGEGGDGDNPESWSTVATRAVVPRWMTVLTMISACDAIATVPLRLAERHADVLGLQVLDAPFVGNAMDIAVARRKSRHDPGADWFLEEVRAAVA
jgi:DNA-binding transcriptional LysR family regulator